MRSREQSGLVVALMVIMIGAGQGNGKEISSQQASSHDTAPHWLARFDEGDDSLRTLFLYTKQDLRSVYVWLHGQWTPARQIQQPNDSQEYFVYRLLSRFGPADDMELLVNSWTASRAATQRHKLHVEAEEGDFRVRGKLVRVRSREEYAAEKRLSQQAADPYGFLPLLNAYRARRGLRRVVYCRRLSQDARINNSRSAPHAYRGGAMVQNWAAGFHSAQGVLRGWQQSPGHNRNLLNPGITRVGIAYSHGEWTFNGG